MDGVTEIEERIGVLGFGFADICCVWVETELCREGGACAENGSKSHCCVG